MPSLNALLISTRYDQIHDDGFAAGQLREMLTGIDGLALTEVSHYEPGALDAADVLVTYIAEHSATELECAALRRFFERGGRWFALHTSNAVEPGCPLPSLLGSRFLTHPPYGPFSASVSKPDDPLLAGIEPFEVEDELYVVDAAADIEVLLHARWGGKTPQGDHFEEDLRPLMYRRRVAQGEVVYLALGHCNPAGIITRGETVAERRGSWQSPVFRELVRRCIDWAVRRG